MNGKPLRGAPFWYRFEQLAIRWGMAPYDLEQALEDPEVQRWVQRGLIFLHVEAVDVR